MIGKMKRRISPSIVFHVRPYLIALLFGLLAACQTGWQGEDRDFRQDMRNLVQSISEYAQARSPGFIVIPQNGHELVVIGEDPSAPAANDYLEAIDGIGREDLYYGYDNDNTATGDADRNEMIPYLDIAEAHGVEVLVTDYCSDPVKMADSYSKNAGKNYISFAADSRDLNTIPSYPVDPYGVNSDAVGGLSDASNFLYLLDPSAYSTKSGYLSALASTNHDIIIMDLFFEDSNGNLSELAQSDLASIDTKADGGERLLICYMSIGEAEDYRYYWDTAWEQDPPAWLEGENRNWPGNYKVQYWDADWQAIIFGGADSYLDKILDAGFDGVYLDIIDAYEYFEG
jgi:cysteinyl-tRNA synthetase